MASKRTRRDFLKAAGIGLAGVVSSGRLLAGVRPPLMWGSARFFVGTYTQGNSEGILCCRFDLRSGKTPIAEAAKRTLPILFTRPGQVYEVDPSRIANLDKVDTEVSGGGPRPFDADQLEYCHLYLTEINKEFERWIGAGENRR